MGRTVLVIDDQLATRRLVQFVLKPLGVDVLEAMDADEALHIAHEQGFDLALVDINLPGIDGLQLLQELRKIDQIVDVPLITFTSRNEKDDETHAREMGASDFLYKPFSTQELRSLVLKHLNKSQ